MRQGTANLSARARNGGAKTHVGGAEHGWKPNQLDRAHADPGVNSTVGCPRSLAHA